jgi:hypothetical protein
VVSAFIGDVARSGLLLIFASSAAEKASLIATRSSRWHPLLSATPLRRRFATPMAIGSLALDVTIVALFIASPHVGTLVAIAAITVYTVFAYPVTLSASGCRCFWRVLPTRSRTALLVRNACLALIALAGLAWSEAISLASVSVATAIVLSGTVVLSREVGSTSGATSLQRTTVSEGEGG